MDAGKNAYENHDFNKAEAYFKKACEDQDMQAQDLRNHAESLKRLGDTYLAQQKLDEAVPAYCKALKVMYKVSGSNSLAVGNAMQGLGETFLKKNMYEDADDCLARALLIKQKMLGANDPEYASLLTDIGKLCMMQQDYDGCEKNLQQALAIYERSGGRHIDDRLAVLQALHELYEVHDDPVKLTEVEHQMNGLSTTRGKEALPSGPLLSGGK